MSGDLLNLRKKVAREAAALLYYGVEKEYKQAKVKAAEIFKVNFLPANLEVALELDKLAEEKEGENRKNRLIKMRKEALKIMKILEAHKPILIGSVWRGSIHHESDIDIIVYHDEPDEIIKLVKQNNLKITQTQWMTTTKKGKRKSSFHIYLELPTKERVEIKVANLEEAGKNEKCEIYGDKIVGLNVQELEKVLRENPTERFLPE